MKRIFRSIESSQKNSTCRSEWDRRKRWLPQAAAGDWLCIFEHDPLVPFGRVVEEKPGRFRALPVEQT